MEKGITIVSPMWGERTTTDRMVFSIIHQYISEENPFNIHLVLVDDYIEGRTEDGESYYNFYFAIHKIEKEKVRFIRTNNLIYLLFRNDKL